jgi:streptogramin lyase
MTCACQRTIGGRLVRFDGARFVTYAAEAFLGSDSIYRIVEDGKGTIWFDGDPETNARGIACLDGERRRFRHFTQDDGLIHDLVTDIAVDQNGEVCFSTDGGLTGFELDRGQFVQFTIEDGLTSAFIGSLTRSHKGHLWFGSEFGKQILAWEGETFVRHTCPFSARAFRCLMEDHLGRLWAAAWSYGGTNEGANLLWRYDGQRWEQFSAARGYSASKHEVETIYEDRAGDIWLGTSSGLLRFREGRFEILGQKPGSAPAECIRYWKTETVACGWASKEADSRSSTRPG